MDSLLKDRLYIQPGLQLTAVTKTPDQRRRRSERTGHDRGGAARHTSPAAASPASPEPRLGTSASQRWAEPRQSSSAIPQRISMLGGTVTKRSPSPSLEPLSKRKRSPYPSPMAEPVSIVKSTPQSRVGPPSRSGSRARSREGLPARPGSREALEPLGRRADAPTDFQFNTQTKLGAVSGGNRSVGFVRPNALQPPELDLTEVFEFVERLKEQPDSLEFVYLSPVDKDSPHYSPYRLRIIAHADINPDDYSTLSAAGLTHFTDGVPEFIPLDQWKRDFELYQAITRIPMFNRYRMWKAYTVWRGATQTNKSAMWRQTLMQRLFLASDLLGPYLRKVRAFCVDMSEKTLFLIDPKRTYTLEEFYYAQLDHREKIKADLDQFAAQVRATVAEACETALAQSGFDEDDHAVADDFRAEQGSFTQQAQKRTECRLLSNFIKLADYLVMNTMYELVVSAANTLLLAVDPPHDASTGGEDDEAGTPINGEEESLSKAYARKEKERQHAQSRALADALGELEESNEHVAMFRINLILHQDMLAFSPNAAAFHEHLTSDHGLIKDAEELVLYNVHKLITDTDFLTQFVSPTLNERLEVSEVGEGAVLSTILEHDVHYQSLLGLIGNGLAAAFIAAEDCAQTFTPYWKHFIDNRELDIDMVRASEPTLAWFRHSIEKYREQIEMMEAMPITSDVGIITIDSSDLRSVLLPSPQRCLQAIETLLPELSKEKSDKLAGQVSSAIARLDRPPQAVGEFVEKMSFVEKIAGELDELQATFEIVQASYALCNEVVKDDDEQYRHNYALYQTLPDKMAEMRNKIDLAEQAREEEILLQSAVLEEDVKVLRRTVLKYRQEVQDPSLLLESSDVKSTLRKLKALSSNLAKLKQDAQKYNQYELMFQVPVSTFDELGDTIEELENKQLLWQSYSDWNALSEEWLESNFEDIDTEAVHNKVQHFVKITTRLENKLDASNVIHHLKTMVDEFKNFLPIVLDMRNPAFVGRHWERITAAVGQRITKGGGFTLQKLVDLDIIEHKEAIEEVSRTATNEQILSNQLSELTTLWEGISFEVTSYKHSKDQFYLGQTEEVQLQLEESHIQVSTIIGSRFVDPVRRVAENWEEDLSVARETLEAWLTCQRQWMYLESIFRSPDIMRQLPDDDKLFKEVDKQWRGVMRRAKDNPNALKLCTQKELLGKLKAMITQCDVVQKSVDVYLDQKRSDFPRFYFLSDEELLKILSQTRDPEAVQPHLRKCFDNIARLQFEGSGNARDIHGMQASDGEVVAFSRPVRPGREAVEVWLTNVEREMKSTLKKEAKTAIVDMSKKPRELWIFDHPAQLVLALSQVAWCHQVEAALQAKNTNNSLVQLLNRCKKQVNDLAKLVRGSLTDHQRLVLTALMTLDVHSRDIVEHLMKVRCSSASDFSWTMQLRYYWEDASNSLMLRQTNASFDYGFEYLGSSSRLVVTPLTDRCYITLTGAMHLKLGGAPRGPAGTGKTETVKDLSKAMAIQCVVFNCSENLDVSMMSRFFSGLAASGAWICFDEFNRIDIEVLSVIATQLVTIRNAKVENKKEFDFEGKMLALKPTCTAFITMNPGYRGRTELPENLKTLFRPIAMMIPDYAMIAEIILLSEGFESARMLARKMTQMYKLASEQLSLAKHYDFGLRAVKSVLVRAGGLKREQSDIPEDITLIRALRDSNLPKFLAEDIPLFHNILNDLFPGVDLPQQDFGDLEEAIKGALTSKNLQQIPSQIAKIIQLYDTASLRHGLMVLGPAGGGKTTVYQVLQEALTLLRKKHPNSNIKTWNPVDTFVLNPKSISMDELYGRVDYNTKEYTPGIITNVVEACVEDTSTHLKWVVFDGPVDATWIENMNTVLDDNKLLCLPNSARIRITEQMRFIFEVDDLKNASPATVSRCGMVYLPAAKQEGWTAYIQSWSIGLTCPEWVQTYIKELCQKMVPPAIEFVRKYCTEYIPSTDISLVASMCALIQALLDESRGFSFSTAQAQLSPFITDVVYFSWIWGIGGNLSKQSKDQFDGFAQDLWKELTKMQGSRDVFAYFLDFELKRFRPWAEVVPTFEYQPESSFFEMLVPTVETVRMQYLLDSLLSISRPVLLSGVTGTGKSVIVSDHIRKTNEAQDYLPITLNMSAQTSSPRMQLMIESKLDKKAGKEVLAASRGRRTILFVDDINMPKQDESGCQPPLELLRQYLDFGGFYDRPALFWKEIHDVTVVAACGPPGGGRNEMSSRLTRHFSMLSIPPAPVDTLQSIFGAILQGFLAQFPSEVSGVSNKMLNACVEVYRRIETELLPTPAKSHYTFNLRDLSKVVQGILQGRVGHITTTEGVVRLWAHENMRIYHDRLVGAEDRTYFTELLTELVRRFFAPMQWNHDAVFVQNPPMFGAFMRMGASDEERVYEEIRDKKKLSKVMNDYLDRFNEEESTPVELVLFTDAIAHLSRICRILHQPRGNALLVGVGGAGKRALTRLAVHMCEMRSVEVSLTRSYGQSDFRDDLKALYQCAGIEGQRVAFILSDTQIVDEAFLEDINSILNSGEVPGLFEGDEFEKIILEMRPIALEAGVESGARDDIYNHFINRVRENLHIVLCMSPVGAAFRRRCLMFPSLVNCCTVDWFDEWPDDALLAVATQSLQKMDLGSAEVANKIAKACMTVHLDVVAEVQRFYEELRRRFYTTPTSYLEFLSVFGTILQNQRLLIKQKRDRYENGLQKLRETNVMVVEMEAQLSRQKPELEEKAKKTDELMDNLRVESAEANDIEIVVEAEEKEFARQTKQSTLAFENVDKELNTAMPALTQAMDALEVLRKDQIAEVARYNTPPKAVETTMEAVCILLGHEGAGKDWSFSKRLLGDPNFLKSLKNYDRENVSPRTMEMLQRFLNDKSFTYEEVVKSSVACANFVKWVRAVAHFSEVFKRVQPIRAAWDEANERLAEMKGKLADTRRQQAEAQAKVAALKASYEETVTAQMQLQEEMDLTQAKLTRAGKLTTSLGDEAERWKKCAEDLDVQSTSVVGDMFLSSAAVAYHGPFVASFRANMVKEWRNLLKDSGIALAGEAFSLPKAIGSAVELRHWQIDGLPTDDFSSENALIMTRGRRWPLLIDPQEQAKQWIRRMETKNGLKTVKLTDKDYLRMIENAIKIGTPVLLEDIGEVLDPALDTLLMKQIVKVGGGRTVIKIGDSNIDYDPAFKFYITTKHPNPHYLPEICIKVAVINFTVTLTGLDDQLLGTVVENEQPELEQQRVELIVSLANDKRTLESLEDKILQLLFNSEGILDDEVLIDTLRDSKESSNTIKERVALTEVTEEKVRQARETYRPMSTRGSILYFVVADMANTDPMYQYSLAYFKSLFTSVLTQTPPEGAGARIATLISALTRSVYDNVSRGLFGVHKILFSFLITVQILLNRGDINRMTFDFLLRGALGNTDDMPPRPEGHAWLTPLMWERIVVMGNKLPFAKGLVEHLTEHLETWNSFVRCNDPLRECIPGRWGEKQALSPFERVTLVNVFRPEFFSLSAAQFVETSLGHEFTVSPPFSLADVFASTDAHTCIIFILSAGADPSSAVTRFAKEKGMSDRLQPLSLGQGQGKRAEKYIRKGMTTGEWIFLQNCHLARSWMGDLETIVKELSYPETEVHPDFRLWLSSLPSKDFPVPVLQNGSKLTDEPPKGIRANLLRSLDTVTPEQYAESSNPKAWRRLQYGLFFFHALVQERKKFGPLGWNNQYEFNASDVETSHQVLRMFIEGDGDSIPFPAILYMTGDIAYGGRVTDEWDRRCLKTTLRRFYTKDIIDGDCKFSSDPAYSTPNAMTLAELRAFTHKLPFSDPPDVFGLHENAGIASLQQESSRMMGKIVALQPRVVTKGAMSNEDLVAGVAADILRRLPPLWDLEDADPAVFQADTSGRINSLSTVLSQETARFARLLSVVRSSLSDVQRAIKGLVVMSEALENLFFALLDNKVPAMWEEVSYLSEKPLSAWIPDLTKRVEFLATWSLRGQPSSFWLSSFFYPQGFLTGVLQNHARKYGIPVDALSFRCSVQTFGVNSVKNPPADGVFIHGLYLDGARWDWSAHRLEDQRPKEIVAELPVIHLLPVENYVRDEATYECPLYKTSERAGVLTTTGQSTNFIKAVDLPTSRPPSHWVLRGVALLTQLNT